MAFNNTIRQLTVDDTNHASNFNEINNKLLENDLFLNNSKVDKSQIKNTLTEAQEGFVLDARQGKALKDYIDSRSGGSSDRIFNVLDYGFDDTGVTTNDEVFVELYSSLKNGDTIYFPAGTYLFDDSITRNKNDYNKRRRKEKYFKL